MPDAGQARARQSRQRASKNRAKSKRYVHKTLRLSQKIGRKQANQSKAEANKGKQETGKKQAESPENAALVHREDGRDMPEKTGQEQTKAGQNWTNCGLNRPVYLVNCTKVGPRKVGNKRQRRKKHPQVGRRARRVRALSKH